MIHTCIMDSAPFKHIEHKHKLEDWVLPTICESLVDTELPLNLDFYFDVYSICCSGKPIERHIPEETFDTILDDISLELYSHVGSLWGSIDLRITYIGSYDGSSVMFGVKCNLHDEDYI